MRTNLWVDMTQLAFNPSELPDFDPGRPALRDSQDAMTVTQATELIQRVLADGIPPTIKIVGEVSNFRDTGHWYLSLKDEQNVLSCVVWASDARKCGFVPQRGQQVLATGQFDYYGPQGRLGFYARRLEPIGQGVLELRFRQLCEELRKLGYFDESRKRPMPRFPEHIAIVTSASGAALQDVVRTARHRWAGVRLSVFDVRVQGDGAAAEIARAVTLLSQQHQRLRIDAIILTRGGGSLEDLWAFNERVVAEAVFQSRVPIAVGVGHETDVTIAELVADLRCSTPTQAAARLVPDSRAERQRLDQMTHRLTHALRRHGDHARTRIESVVRHPVFRRPTDRLVQLHQRLDHLRLGLASALHRRAAAVRRILDEHRHALATIEPVGRLRSAAQQLEAADRALRAAIARRLQSRRDRVDALERHLSCVGHQSILSRGYTYTTDRSGRVLRSCTVAQQARVLVTHFVDGQVESEVRVGGRGAPQQPLVPKRRRPAARAGQAELFE